MNTSSHKQHEYNHMYAATLWYVEVKVQSDNEGWGKSVAGDIIKYFKMLGFH